MAGNKRQQSGDFQSNCNAKKSRTGQGVEPRIHPTYGQRSAIPGLDDDTAFNGGDELDYTEDMNALDYLRSVRHEATGIPNLLVAPRTEDVNYRAIYEDGNGDFRGRYEDGAYVAFSDASQPLDEEDEEITDLHIPYYDAILERYNTLRDQLQQTPPPEVTGRLSKEQQTYVQHLSRGVLRHWTYIMSNVNPVPAQVACMSKESVLRLLDLLARDKLIKRGNNISLCVSHWTWSLLARLPDRGELSSEEIGTLRELGKKAVLVGTGLGEAKSWEAGIQEIEADLNGHSSTPEMTSGLEGHSGEGDEDEGAEIVNDDEISLDLELDLDEYPRVDGGEESFFNPEAPEILNTIVANVSEEEQQIDNSADTPTAEKTAATINGDEDFEAIKARLLQNLSTREVEFSVNLEPEIIADPEPGTELQPEPESKCLPEPEPNHEAEMLKWNTKATVDMIITVAGEVYGQRDLLEFRNIWASTM